MKAISVENQVNHLEYIYQKSFEDAINLMDYYVQPII